MEDTATQPSPWWTTLVQADAHVEQSRSQPTSDPLHPIFHVTPVSRIIGDPNGPVWFKGRYHIFYQHFPYAGDVQEGDRPFWGHASSLDQVHWRHEPIALMPGPEKYDMNGNASGGCVVANGVPTMSYTGVNESGQQVQCIATSRDNLRTWQKDPANPVIAKQSDIEGLDGGFRDPFTWQEGDEWRMILGSGFKKGMRDGGTVLLYRSKNLRQWEYLGHADFVT